MVVHPTLKRSHYQRPARQHVSSSFRAAGLRALVIKPLVVTESHMAKWCHNKQERRPRRQVIFKGKKKRKKRKGIFSGSFRAVSLQPMEVIRCSSTPTVQNASQERDGAEATVVTDTKTKLQRAAHCSRHMIIVAIMAYYCNVGFKTDLFSHRQWKHDDQNIQTLG